MGGMGGMGGGMGGGSAQPQPPGASAMASGGSQPGANPMVQARDQFQALGSQIQAMTQMYPMAQQELGIATQALLAAMIKVAQGVQQEPAMPGIPV